MSMAAMAWAMRQELSAIPKMILITLADHYNDETGQCNPSVKRISIIAGVVQRTVEHHIETLQNSKLLTVTERRRDDGSRTSNQYDLNLGSKPNSPGGAGVNALGSNVKSPGGAVDAPGDEPASPLEPGRELGIEEPTKESFTAVQDSLVRKNNHKKTTEIDQTFRDAMRERFPSLSDLDERIEEALAHKAAANYTDLQAYVRGWLRRDAKNIGPPHGPNGTGQAGSPEGPPYVVIPKEQRLPDGSLPPSPADARRIAEFKRDAEELQARRDAAAARREQVP